MNDPRLEDPAHKKLLPAVAAAAAAAAQPTSSSSSPPLSSFPPFLAHISLIALKPSLPALLRICDAIPDNGPYRTLSSPCFIIHQRHE